MSSIPRFEDSQKNGEVTVGVDKLMAHKVISAASPLHLDPENSLNLPLPTSNVRPYNEHYVDVEPVEPAKFGQQCTFRYGNEGFSNLVAAELIFRLPALGDSTNSGETGSGINWVPYVGERLVGNDDELMRQRHGTKKLREYNSTSIHVKRALCMDNEGSSQRAAYDSLTGASSDDCSQEREYVHTIWLPWAKDAVDPRQAMPMHAFSIEQEMKFKIPPIAELVQSDTVLAGNLVVQGTTDAPSTLPECYLRLHYVTLEQEERVRWADMALKEGIVRPIMTIARELTSSALVTGQTAITVEIEITQQSLPCVFLAFVVRHVDDLKAVGASALHAATANPDRTSAGGSPLVEQPDWTRFLPWDTVQIVKGGSALTNKFSRNYLENSLAKGKARFFPSDKSGNIGFMTFTYQPTVETHGLGHHDFTPVTKPVLKIELPALTGGNASDSAQRRIDVFYFERNVFNALNGKMQYVFDSNH